MEGQPRFQTQRCVELLSATNIRYKSNPYPVFLKNRYVKICSAQGETTFNSHRLTISSRRFSHIVTSRVFWDVLPDSCMQIFESSLSLRHRKRFSTCCWKISFQLVRISLSRKRKINIYRGLFKSIFIVFAHSFYGMPERDSRFAQNTRIYTVK